MSRKKNENIWCPPFHPITTSEFRLVSTAPDAAFSMAVENFKDDVLEQAFRDALDEIDEPLQHLWEAARESADLKVFFKANQLKAAEEAVWDSMLVQLMRFFSGHVFAEVVSCRNETERYALPEDLLRRCLTGYAVDWAICWEDVSPYADTALSCAANFLEAARQQIIFLRDPATGRSSPALVFAPPGETDSAPDALILSAGERNDDRLVNLVRYFVLGDPLEFLGMERDCLPHWAVTQRLDEAWKRLISACPLASIIEHADIEHDGDYEEPAVTAAKIRSAIEKLAAEATKTSDR